MLYYLPCLLNDCSFCFFSVVGSSSTNLFSTLLNSSFYLSSPFFFWIPLSSSSFSPSTSNHHGQYPNPNQLPIKNTSSFMSHCAKISSGDIPNSDSIHWAGLLSATLSKTCRNLPSTHPELPLEHSLITLLLPQTLPEPLEPTQLGTFCHAINSTPYPPLIGWELMYWHSAVWVKSKRFMSSPPTGSHCPSPSWKSVLSELE